VARRRRHRGIRPALLGFGVLALAACGASTEISADLTKPSPSIQPSACDLLTDADIAAAVTLPATASPSASAAAPAITHVYSVEKLSLSGTKTVGQCTWTSDGGAQVIALVIPNTKLTTLAAYTAGATQVGPAYVQEGTGRGFVSVQDGSAVIAITLVLDADEATRTAHLADLARVASGAPVPSVSPGALASAAATSSAASGPGTVVQGQTADAVVKQTDALQFSPTSVTIKAGQVLEWDNSGSIAHNVTFDSFASITSDTMNGGDKFEVKFLLPGTYPFHCTFHPGMDGQVTVQ